MSRRLLLVLLVSACAPDISVDADELTLTAVRALFVPADGILPWPNDHWLNDGHVALPPSCSELPFNAALRNDGLAALDGFGAFEVPLEIPFDVDVDLGSLAGRLFLFDLGTLEAPTDPETATPIAVTLSAGSRLALTPDCATGRLLATVVMLPNAPLLARHRYGAVLMKGALSSDGRAFEATPDWVLTRSETSPVRFAPRNDAVEVVYNATPYDPTVATDLAKLMALEKSWLLHREVLTFVSTALSPMLADGSHAPQGREDLLLAWQFTTATLSEPLDPSEAQSLAAVARAATSQYPNLQTVVTDPGVIQTRLGRLLEAVWGNDPCAEAVPCAAVGTLVEGSIDSASFQTERPNPGGLPTPVPGPWAQPVSPDIVSVKNVRFISFAPATAAPAAGFPTVLFGHGISRSKEDLYALAAELAASGFQSIALDWQGHGSRAVRISSNIYLGCSGSPTPQNSPQCFARPISEDLLASRDNLRQSILDELQLIRVLRACGPVACEGLSVDPDRLGFIGQSLGAMLGLPIVALSPHLKAAVLNTGAVGYVDVVNHTDSAFLRCPIVDALIDAQVVVGEKWFTGSGLNNAALCLDEALLADSAYQGFSATARWLLDPADGANYVARLQSATRPVLLQEIADDAVVPNVATETLGTLLGLEAVAAANTSGTTLAPTPEALSTGQHVRIRYTTSSSNRYAHASLLLPADTSAAAAHGTRQLQRDALTFLVNNL